MQQLPSIPQPTSVPALLCSTAIQLASLIGIIWIALVQDGAYNTTVLIGLMTIVTGSTIQQVSAHWSASRTATTLAKAAATVAPVSVPTPPTE